MSGDSKRTAALLSALAAAALLVVLDRATGGPGGGDAAAAGDGAYAVEAAQLAQARAAAASAVEWEAAADRAAEAWEARRGLAISAPSAAIAAARLRSLIEPILADEGLSLVSSETLPARAAGESGRVMVVGLSASIESRDAESVYRFIDRVEHLPEARATVEAMALRGPGRLGGAGRLSATLRLRAAAVIEGSGARG